MSMNTNARGVTAFLAITFAGSWGWMIGARLLLGLSTTDPVVQLPFALMPAVAAVVVRRLVTREGFADAALRLNLRAGHRYYLAALLGPAVIAAATVSIAVFLAGIDPNFGRLSTLLPGLPPAAAPILLMAVAVVLTPVYWGEEFGWTGYLRQRLFTDRPMLSVLATGLIWAIWHYPLAMLGYIEFPHLAVGLAGWTVSILFQEYLLSWLRTRSGSIWPSSLAHAGNNMVLSLLVALVLDGSGYDVLALTLIPVPALAATALWAALLSRHTERAQPATPTATPTATNANTTATATAATAESPIPAGLANE